MKYVTRHRCRPMKKRSSPQLARELFDARLGEVHSAFGEEIDVERCLAELVIGQILQPLCPFRL